MKESATSRLPLAGIRVLDLSRLMAGNMLTLQLADFGAEVIKVESAQGDTLRDWKNGGKALWWKVYGRNKKSIRLDLKDEGDRNALLQLVPQAQVVIESFRHGGMEAFGLGPDDLHAVNPKLVIVRISGWGQTGPYAERPGFGTLVEAFSGFAERNGFPDKPPALPNLGLADMIAGLSGAFATLAAVREVEVNGGEGQVVDLSLLEPMIGVLGPDAAIYQHTGRRPRRLGNRAENAAPRNAYLCSDGHWMVMSGSTQRMAERVLAAIGRPELARDPLFVDNAARIANVDALDELIGGFIGQRTLQENLAHFGRHEVTVGPVLNVDELMQHPHVREREVLVEVPDPELGSVVMHNVFPRLSRTPGRIRSTAPQIGQDQHLVTPPTRQQETEP
ncbi:CaiB/BaiF CoA transferase family protein [Ramlibacter sp. Leaf400]|uniref:CaiB/BaiF CoA transferase family protein n=1 Tax=Ramlibacter sp. Leaf400 TaxID=1736365 RepID=UPI000702165A|nr:CoA transferase [Ramlibacter sp. Leaf400]KQT11258.1 acyl-CoA transferase [Ramlibacter sp. Leaf400]